MTNRVDRDYLELKAWLVLSEKYTKRADTSTAADALASLVLAQYCVHAWSGDYGGPTDEMVRRAEQITGEAISLAYERELGALR